MRGGGARSRSARDACIARRRRRRRHHRRLGRLLGKGRTLAEALTELHSTAEGVYTAAAAVRSADAHGIEVPIAAAVHAIIEGMLSVDAAIEGLLSRPFRSEM